MPCHNTHGLFCSNGHFSNFVTSELVQLDLPSKINFGKKSCFLGVHGKIASRVLAHGLCTCIYLPLKMNKLINCLKVYVQMVFWTSP